MQPSPDRPKYLFLEVMVIACLAVLPEIAYSFLFFNEPHTGLSPEADYGSLLMRSLQVGVPALWIIGWSGDGWELFGLRRLRPLRDVGLALAIFILASVAAVFTAYLRRYVLHDRDPAGLIGSWLIRPTSALQWGLLFLALVANSFAEELVMRGYLIPRFEEMARSRVVAVVVAAVLWGAYHSYQGPYAAIDIAIWGLIMGAFYVRTRRLWPLVIAHTLWNLVAYAPPQATSSGF